MSTNILKRLFTGLYLLNQHSVAVYADKMFS